MNMQKMLKDLQKMQTKMSQAQTNLQSQSFEAEAGGGLMVAIIQLAITMGASIGGLFFDTLGYEATFVFSSACLACSMVLATIGSHISNHRKVSLNS